jgi:hypothetical protein
MSLLSRYADEIQAGAALVTAITALLGVSGLLAQMKATDRMMRTQTAREAYATHLMASVAHPDLAAPADACALMASPDGAAYAAYVDHLLYASELVMKAEPDQTATLEAALAPHAAYVCAHAGAVGMDGMLAGFVDTTCPKMPPCPDAPPG